MKVPLLNFVGGPGVPLLNLEGGLGVLLLNFRGVPGPTFKLWGGSKFRFLDSPSFYLIQSLSFLFSFFFVTIINLHNCGSEQTFTTIQTPNWVCRSALWVPKPWMQLVIVCALKSCITRRIRHITALMKRPENNFPLTDGRWKFNMHLELNCCEQNS